MLVSVDLQLELGAHTFADLNGVSYSQQLDVVYAINKYIGEYGDKFIGTFNIDTEEGYMRLTHINGLAVVYDDFIKTNDEYVNLE